MSFLDPTRVPWTIHCSPFEGPYYNPVAKIENLFLGILVVIVVRRRRDRDDSRGAYTAGGSAFATTRDDYKPIVRGDFSSSASSTPSGTEV